MFANVPDKLVPCGIPFVKFGFFFINSLFSEIIFLNNFGEHILLKE